MYELRIVSRQQFVELFGIDQSLSKLSVHKHLIDLKENGLIDSITDSSKQGNPKYYFLTQLGHQSIGGFLTLPKVPEYNLYHHLQINDYLILILKMLNGHPHFVGIITERRKVFETKDGQLKKSGKKYFVPDFVFRFMAEDGAYIDWSFEIELTLKSRYRYKQNIFPKYIRELENSFDAQLFYVTPSPVIQHELDLFRQYFIKTKGDEFVNVFPRLHVFSAENLRSQSGILLPMIRILIGSYDESKKGNCAETCGEFQGRKFFVAPDTPTATTFYRGNKKAGTAGGVAADSSLCTRIVV